MSEIGAKKNRLPVGKRSWVLRFPKIAGEGCPRSKSSLGVNSAELDGMSDAGNCQHVSRDPVVDGMGI